jgi:hypothetical protein
MACATPMPKTENPVYLRAKPETQSKILSGYINVGMTVDECKLAWNRAYFELIRNSSTRRGDYQLWKVWGNSTYLYLHVYDGIVEEVAEYQK